MIVTLALVVVVGLVETASAATHVLRPEGPPATQNDWRRTPAAAQAWQTIDDPVLQPTPPKVSDYIRSDAANEITAVSLGTRALRAEIVNSGKAWFHAQTGGQGARLRVEVIWNGQVQAEKIVGTGQPLGWHSLKLNTFPGTQAAVDSLRLRFKVIDGNYAKVTAAYISLHTTNLGFNAHLTNIDPASPTPDALANLAHASLGPNATLRYPVDWREVAREPAGVGWTRPDNAYNATLAVQGKPVLIVYGTLNGFGRTGCVGAAGTCPPDPMYFPQFTEFVRSVAARYPAAAAIEIWNEPNNQGNWDTPTGAAGARGAEYAELFEAGARGVRQASQTMPVLFGALQPAPEQSRPELTNHKDFLTDFYNNVDRSLLRPIDGLSIHPYIHCDPSKPSTLVSDSRMVRDKLDAGRALWMTEFGFKTTARDCSGSEAQQSSNLLRQMGDLASGGDVEAALIHTIVDPTPQPPPPDYEVGFGLVEFGSGRPPFDPKLAFCALAANRGRPPPGPPLVSPSC